MFTWKGERGYVNVSDTFLSFKFNKTYHHYK